MSHDQRNAGPDLRQVRYGRSSAAIEELSQESGVVEATRAPQTAAICSEFLRSTQKVPVGETKRFKTHAVEERLTDSIAEATPGKFSTKSTPMSEP